MEVLNTPPPGPHLILGQQFLTPQDLQALGLTRHLVAKAVGAGRLLRLRKGRLIRSDAHPDLIRAGRMGGRLDCLSLLAAIGVFVLAKDRLHVQIEVKSSRLPHRAADVVPHWRRSTGRRTDLAADLVEALAQACRCQPPREAIATLDSAWHQGLVDEGALAAVFARLPRRYQRLRGLLDRRSESGPETLMRLLLRGLGCDVDVQVQVPRVGRVDFIVDGWLIVECDSEAHHAGWAAQKRDRRRDLAAAAQGYTTVRPVAEDILHHREEVLAMMKAILAAHGPR